MYAGGIRMSSSRRARRALKPNTLPTIELITFEIEPSSNRSSG